MGVLPEGLTRPKLRKLLEASLSVSSDRWAFLVDYFPDLAARASEVMDAKQLFSLLFQLHAEFDIYKAIEQATSRDAGMQGRVKRALLDLDGEGAEGTWQVASPSRGFNLPAFDPWFTGRQDSLAQIQPRLAQQHGLAICGLGGLGKSSLARAYLYQHISQYTFAGWLPAAEPASLQAAYLDLAAFLYRRGLCSIPPPIQEPQRRLAFVLNELAHLENWVLVFDNADQPEELSALWPNVERGFLLITSRHPDPGRFPVYELPPWNEDEALDFLRRRSRQALSGKEEAPARQLLREVETLPLAVEQIGTYLVRHNTQCRRYLKAFESERTRLFPKATTSNRMSVATVWSLSFCLVEADSPAAADLLRVSAYLSPDSIPEFLLLAGASHFGETLQAALTKKSPLAVDEVLGPLFLHSLVRRWTDEDGEAFYGVHRLVQDVMRHQLREAGVEERWREQALAALATAFPEVEFSTWERCRVLLPSVESLLPHCETVATPVATKLWNNAGLYLYQQGNYAQAEPLFRRSLAMRENAPASEYLSVAQSLNNLGILLKTRGRLADAEPLFRQSLQIWESELGEWHPDVGISLNNLALLLKEQGKLDEAESLLRRDLTIGEKALGSEHPHVALSLNNLALILQLQGKRSEVESTYRRSLAIMEKALGPEHPHVAQNLNNLASLLHAQGELSAANSLYRRSLKIREKSLGLEHPDVAQGLNNLAALMRDLGELREAEELQRRSLKIWGKSLGFEHPDFSQGLNNLALILQTQGKLDEAEPLYRRGLQILEKALGPDHPSVATKTNNLALLLQTQGKLDEAEPLYRRSLQLWQKALSPEHPQIGTGLNNLASLLHTQGRLAEAEPFYHQSLKIWEEAWGHEHIYVGSSLNNLASLLHAQGKLAEAEPLFHRSIAILTKALGQEHPSTKTVGENLNRLRLERKQRSG